VTITVMATDNGSRGLNGPCVRKQDASDAIREEKPHIVICSWMVISSDFFFHGFLNEIFYKMFTAPLISCIISL